MLVYSCVAADMEKAEQRIGRKKQLCHRAEKRNTGVEPGKKTDTKVPPEEAPSNSAMGSRPNPTASFPWPGDFSKRLPNFRDGG